MDIRRVPPKSRVQPVKRPSAESVSQGRQEEQREVLKEVFTESENVVPVVPKKKVLRESAMDRPTRKKGPHIVFVAIFLFAFLAWYYRGDISSLIYIEDRDTKSEQVMDSGGGDLVVSEGTSGVFDPDAFYGVETHDGTQYFARITLYDGHFYKLEDIFYDESNRRVDDVLFSSSIESATSTTSTAGELVEEEESESGTITLVKFGTEEFQPDDTLLLPKDDVRQVFPLSPASPIRAAILEYLDS